MALGTVAKIMSQQMQHHSFHLQGWDVTSFPNHMAEWRAHAPLCSAPTQLPCCVPSYYS